MKKLMVAVAAAGLALTAAACTNEAAGSTAAKHPTHKTSCHVITAKAHIEGTGQYLLTLKGVKNPVAVPKPAYKVADIGSRYCADK